MRKTILYLLLLAVVAFGVYYFIFSDRDMFGVDEAGFTVKDTASISRIFIADRAGESISLERKDEGWYLDGKYRAIASTVNTFLQMLITQTAMYPVPESMHNSTIKLLATKGVKVELYNKRGTQMRVFYVGGQTGSSGSFMLMEGAKRPYVVQIPGFPGYVTPRYSTDMGEWRDRMICDIPADQLSSVDVKYPSEPLNSFVLKQDNGKVSVLVDSNLSKGKEFNERRAKVYSKFFEKLYCEGYINGVAKLDSVIRSVPLRCALDIQGNKGQKQHIDIYWMRLNRRSKNMLTPDPTLPAEYDADRFYAVTNELKDTILIQRGTFEKIFRKAYEFYQPDDTSTVRTINVNARGARAGSIKISGQH